MATNDTPRPKVLLLNPPSSKLQVRDFYCSVTSKGDYCWAPMDLLVISGHLDSAFDLEVVDAIAERLSPEEAMRRALAARPDAVVAMTSSASYEEDAAFLADLRRQHACLVTVSGNICLDRRPWLLRTHPWLDATIKDFTSGAIADYFLARGRPDGALPGIDFRQGDTIVEGASPKEERRLRYPVPRHDLFPLARYRLPYSRRFPLATVMAGYGCPYTCSFCVYSRDLIGYRVRPVEDVVAELESLRQLGVAELYFRDPLFAADRRQALALCEAMRGMDFLWSCDCRTDRVDEELLVAMKEAGCVCIAFGIESADETLLARHGKSALPGQGLDAIALCRKVGILSAGYFILGLPGQDEASARRTIRFAVQSGLDFASFSAAAPEHGTALREEALSAGRIQAQDPSQDQSQAARSLTDGLSDRRLRYLLRRASLEFYCRPSYVLRTLSRVRSLRELGGIVRAGLAVLKHYD